MWDGNYASPHTVILDPTHAKSAQVPVVGTRALFTKAQDLVVRTRVA